MKTLTAELVETGEKRDARGQRVMRAEVREALLAAYASSGMTQRAFAEREGVKYCTLAIVASASKAGGEVLFELYPVRS